MSFHAAGGVKTLSYAQLAIQTRAYAGALLSLGLKSGDRVAIQGENCVEWALVDWACRTLGIVLVPLYPSLPSDQSQFIVSDCGAKLVIAGNKEQAAKCSGWVILLTGEGPESITSIAASSPESVSLADWNSSIDQIAPEDIATIIYTSGTTGNPKGAELSHRSFLHVCHYALEQIPLTEHDVFLTFLPMSHVFERIAGQALPISIGAHIFYSKSLLSLASDMQAATPTVLLCVPRFLESTMDKFIDAVKKESKFKQAMFRFALDQGFKRFEGRFAPFAAVMDKLVGEKIRKKVGGRLRFFVSGGAALPPHVARFYFAFGLPVLQGYGLTETCGGSFLNHPDRNKYWTVGEPLGMECKIAEDGEILMRGGGLMTGYHNLEQATREAIDPEGWFHTGDIGEFEGKHLKITDRKKDLLVLANGKNVAPQPIESKFKESQLISEIVLFGDSNEYIYGLLVPNFDRLSVELNAESASHDELLNSDAAKSRMKSEVDAINKTLADFEKLKRYALIDATFSIESGELTPSLKVKRKVVKTKYQAVLDTLTKN